LHFQANYETSFPAIQKNRSHCHDSLNFDIFGEHTIVVEKWQYQTTSLITQSIEIKLQVLKEDTKKKGK
jgi:hypothetical protein